ncbi:hypothetical protein BH11MYX4_BH11MYX4_53230 [soil metagenome]
MRFLEARGVTVRANASADGTMALMGNVKEGRQELHPSLIMDSDGRIVRAECSCNYFQQNQLRKGPCEHMLAIRMQHQRQVH